MIRKIWWVDREHTCENHRELISLESLVFQRTSNVGRVRASVGKQRLAGAGTVQPEKVFQIRWSTLQRGRRTTVRLTKVMHRSLSKMQFDFAGEKPSFSSKGRKDVPETKRDIFPISSKLDGLRSSLFRVSAKGTALGWRRPAQMQFAKLTWSCSQSPDC